jgi:hypothetical protein
MEGGNFMKKMVVFFVLLALLATAVFAELNIGFDARVNTDLLYATKGTGEENNASTDTKVVVGKDDVGSINFFNSNYALGPGSKLALTFTHTTDNTEASMQLKTSGLLGRMGKLSNTKWTDFLAAGVGDWYFKGNLGMLDGYVGNTGYGGKVGAFDNFNDFLNSDEKPFHHLGGFGVYRTGLNWGGSDAIGIWGDEIFALGASYGNFKVAAGSYLGQNGYDTPFGSKASANAAFILSGGMEAVTVDVFYGVNGSDAETKLRNDGNGAWQNRFGVYAGFGLMDGLGASIGYTGDVNLSEAQNDPADTSETKTKSIPVNNPLFSGVDLHFNFTGIDNLGVTFNNNLSFASVKGIENNGKDKIVSPLYSSGTFSKDDKQDWFVYTGGILATYALSDELTVAFQMADQAGVATRKYKDAANKDETNTITTNVFRAVVSAEYKVGFAAVGCGLSLGVTSYTDKTEAAKTDTEKENITTFGIPMYFRVSF